MAFWNFREDLAKLCAKCTELKPSTAKNYARKFAKEWDEYSFYYTNKDIREIELESKAKSRAIECLLKDVITFNGGMVRISDVSLVQSEGETIILTLKNKGTVRLKRASFPHAKYIFNYD